VVQLFLLNLNSELPPAEQKLCPSYQKIKGKEAFLWEFMSDLLLLTAEN